MTPPGLVDECYDLPRARFPCELVHTLVGLLRKKLCPSFVVEDLQYGVGK
jgi:hypothetical protein